MVEPDVEVAILAGGASTRMGSDKASLLLDGMPIVERTARMLREAGMLVAVLGGRPVPNARYRADGEVFGGPLAALAGFRPERPFVFVASCDIPALHPCVPLGLRRAIGEADAAVPLVAGRAQPLCALYRADAFAKSADLHRSGERRIMRWLDSLDVRSLDESALVAVGIAPFRTCGANTPEEWDRLAGLAVSSPLDP